MIKYECVGKQHQELCPYHVQEELACYCSIEGCYKSFRVRNDLSCWDCYHGLMTEEEVREMDD